MSLSFPEELMDGIEDLDVRPGDFLDQPVLLVSGALHKLQLSVYAMVCSSSTLHYRDTILSKVQW